MVGSCVPEVAMLLTLDGTGDEFIEIQGLPSYSFCDDDAGSDEAGSVEDEIGQDLSDEEANGSDDDSEYATEEDDWDEEDDTAEIDEAAAAALGVQTAPTGFEVLDSEPTIGNDLIGQKVLFKWIGTPLGPDEFGWYMGTIFSRATEADQRKHPGVNFLVRYRNGETGGVIPACRGLTGRKTASYPQQLGSSNWGVNQLWVLLQPDGSGSLR